MMTSSPKASSKADEHGSPEFPQLEQAIILITGIQASGKSTVAQALAERLPRSVHVRGDQFRRMVVNDRADMTSAPSDEAIRQLRLRHQLTAHTSDDYFRAGFTVVAQDVILGEHLAQTVAQIHSTPLLVVVLAPEPETVLEREAVRTKNAYDTLTVHMLDKVLREETAHLGLWIDTSFQTPAETVDEILARAWTEARIGEPTA
ncbi:AAA family ATPase [Streptomyces sp. NPDC087844]|uniref:AAA family ATPase n=1 Tax=Streptomyces sp. NPDC087844 TaxID=3365805 RepID=UPI0038171EAE